MANNMFGRIIALALLFVSAWIPLNLIQFVVLPEVQMVVGTLIVLYIVLVDAVGGFIAGVAVLIMYFRVFGNKFGLTWGQAIGLKTVEKPYVSEQLLESAQSNVFSKSDLNVEMKGIKGVYGEEVYGAQGQDRSMPGFEPNRLGEEIKFD
jgi:hypothetical protein